MILSRLPVRQAYRHLLPSPIDPGKNGMPRIAVEACVSAPGGELRVITTHLEYYSDLQRRAQVDRLRSIHAEGHGHARAGSIVDQTGGPFHTHLRPKSTIITGDFNLEPEDPVHARMGDPFSDGTSRLADAWMVTHPGVPHPGTFKLYEKGLPRAGRAALRLHLRERGSRSADPIGSGRSRNAGCRPPAGHPYRLPEAT
jgi:endonuclease/exonuclease/phosphatase family metal-dependent hydrolase